MKTIKSIRKTKEVELGEIRRVDDKTAHNMVGSSWQYVSKTEWKKSTRNQVGTKLEPSQDKVETEQLEKKPYKKGQKSEKHKNKD
jgi:hypothetical protein